MKTLIYFLITSIISTGALLSALTMSNQFIGQTISLAVWILFFWGLSRRSKQAAKRKEREKLFNEWVNSKRNRKY